MLLDVIVYECLLLDGKCVQPRYRDVKQINLEFAQGIEDEHFELLRNNVRYLLI